jgi:hypothetical protein
LLLSDATDLARVVVDLAGISSNRVALTEAQAQPLAPGREFFWKVVARNRHGETESVGPSARFRVDASLPPLSAASRGTAAGPDGVLVQAALRGEPQPRFGALAGAEGLQPAEGVGGQTNQAVELNGAKGMIVYALAEFPEEDYSCSAWVRVARLPEGRLGQVFSAWAGPMDDPLRVCVGQGRLFARLETAGQGFSTEGVVIEAGRWYHVAAVKQGAKLTLFLDGAARASATVPAEIHSAARDFALGGNPHYTGNEFLAVRLADFAFHARALSAEEVRRLASRTQ